MGCFEKPRAAFATCEDKGSTFSRASLRARPFAMKFTLTLIGLLLFCGFAYMQAKARCRARRGASFAAPEKVAELQTERRRKPMWMPALFYVASCLFVLLGLYGLLYGAQLVKTDLTLARSGLTAEAEIVRVDVEERRYRHDDREMTRLVYYEVVRYEPEPGRTVEARFLTSREEGDVRKPGETVLVRFDPAKPSIVVEAGSRRDLVTGILTTVFSGCVILAALFFAMKGSTMLRAEGRAGFWVWIALTVLVSLVLARGAIMASDRVARLFSGDARVSALEAGERDGTLK